jgi:hypothetical protein
LANPRCGRNGDFLWPSFFVMFANTPTPFPFIHNWIRAFRAERAERAIERAELARDVVIPEVSTVKPLNSVRYL